MAAKMAAKMAVSKKGKSKDKSSMNAKHREAVKSVSDFSRIKNRT